MVKRVSLVMPSGMWEQIGLIASVDDKLPSEVIRDAIREYIDGLDWKHYAKAIEEMLEDEDEDEDEYVEDEEEVKDE